MTEQEYKPGKAGTVFKPETRKLYVFSSNGISVLAGWPRPMAWRKGQSDGQWKPFRPGINIPCSDLDGRIRRLEFPADRAGQILMPFCLPPREVQANRARLAWLRWYSTIPAEVREVAGGFPQRQWHMLSFLARCGEAAFDLARSNPALAYALSSNWVYHRPAVRQPLRSARALLRPGRKQRDILAWLGFPGTESARKMLAKVVHKAICIRSLLYLQQGAADAAVAKAAAHLPRLNAGALRIATDPALLPLVAPTLLDEVSHSREEEWQARTAHLLQDSVAMYRLLFPNRTYPGPVRCLRQLAQFHDDLAADLNRAHCLDMDISFFTPPIPGTDTIVPITTARELAAEGRLQQNCVASYFDRVAVQQRFYIYRVSSPERCTLALIRRGNTWGLAELLRAHNQQPSEETRRVVRQWLELPMSSRIGPGCIEDDDDWACGEIDDEDDFVPDATGDEVPF